MANPKADTTSTKSKHIAQALAHAIACHQSGDLSQAEQAYEEVLSTDPKHPQALNLLGVIAKQLGNSALAKERILESLELDPRQASALSNLGSVYAQEGDLAPAIECYEKAIALKPDFQMAHQNLGDVYLILQQYAQCIECYRQVLALGANSVAYCKLGKAYEQVSDFDAALDNYRAAIADNAKSVVGHSRLGAILRKLGRIDEAKTIYQQWLNFDPKASVARHFLAACSGEKLNRASAEYVEALFDEQFAEKFDETLGTLDYCAPELVVNAAKAHFSASSEIRLRVADLGCGTGLCGPLLRADAAYLVGVDLAPAMLALAKDRDVYDDLEKRDLVAFLQARENAFDVLISADTLNYLGDLQPVMSAAACALRAGGVFAFSLEHGGDAVTSDFALTVSGRYVHNQSYIEDLIAMADLHVLTMVQETLRMEAGQPVTGLIVVVGKAS